MANLKSENETAGVIRITLFYFYIDRIATQLAQYYGLLSLVLVYSVIEWLKYSNKVNRGT